MAKNTSTPTAQDLLTARRVSEMLGYSVNTLAMARSTGRLGGVAAPDFMKAGKSMRAPVRYKRGIIEKWVEANGKAPGMGEFSAP